MSVSFFVPGRPAPGGSKKAFPIFRGKGESRVFTGRVAVTDAAGQANKDWRGSVVQFAFKAMEEAGLAPFDCALRAQFEFRMPRPKYHFKKDGSLKPDSPNFHTITPDVLKLTRSTEDAMKGIVYRDDCLICQETLSKVYSDMPGCAISISALT